MLDSIDTRRALNVIGVLVLLAVVVPFVIVAVPQVVGANHSFVVLSGSMQPSMGPGDVVIVDEVPPEEIAEGDVITFSDGRSVTTHQVVGIEAGQDGRVFATRGTANDAADPRPVPEDAVIGEVAFVLPWVGHVVLFAQTRLGVVTLIAVPGFLLVISELYTLAQARNRSRSSEEQ